MLLAVIAIQTTVNVVLFIEIKKPEVSPVTTEVPMDEHQVISIVDARMAALKKREAKKRLADIEQGYLAAAEQTPNNFRIYGDSQARFTLQMFSDIECPYCRKMHDGVKQVIDRSDGVINWEFKHFPLGMHNPAAAVEAEAIECIASLYDNRKAWVMLEIFVKKTGGNGQGVEDIPALASEMGLNGERIKSCMDSNNHKGIINSNFNEGRQKGITSTPAIVIIDNETGKESLVRGFKTPEQLLQALQSTMQL